MFTWLVDGQDNLFQQWFWFRVGPTGPEASIDTLVLDAPVLTDTNGSGSDNNLFLRYTDPGGGFEITINFNLAGGQASSGASDIAETITINNLTGSSLDMHFFQYVDFDLNGTIGDDSVVLVNANTVRQSDSVSVLAETVASRAPDHTELNTFPTTILSLNDGIATTLNDAFAIGVTLGPTDATWAFQWDQVISGNGTFQISKDKNIRRRIPEPATLGLFGIGLAFLGVALRRRKRIA